MAKQLKIRFARPDEAETIVDWLNKHQSVNQYNPEVLQSPSLRVMCSYTEEGEPQQYMLLDRVLMLDSAAPKPGLDKLTAAQSFRDFTKGAELLASAEGIKSIYALDCGDGLDKLAQNHAYELLGKEVNGKFEPFRIYRIKV